MAKLEQEFMTNNKIGVQRENQFCQTNLTPHFTEISHLLKLPAPVYKILAESREVVVQTCAEENAPRALQPHRQQHACQRGNDTDVVLNALQ